MRIHFRPAEPNDVDVLVEIYDRAYRGGYSACFDKYGVVTPQDFWWVQSEKSVLMVEVDRRPTGLIILGKTGRNLLAEEILIDWVDDTEALLRQLHDFLVGHFQRERQDLLTIRCAETNTAALALAHRFQFAFANALVVVRGPLPSGESVGVRGAVPAPQGYTVRRAAAQDAKSIARLHGDLFHVVVKPAEIETIIRQPDGRVFVGERGRLLIALALAQVKDGVGRWMVGVRDAHSGRGLGTALTHAALSFLHAKELPAVSTYWALDAQAAGFARSLGCSTERTYLYFERRL